MTPAQSAELEALDAEIAARPDDSAAYFKRALLLAKSGGAFARLVEDGALGLRISWGKNGNDRPTLPQLVVTARARWQDSQAPHNPAAVQRFMRAIAVAEFALALEQKPALSRWLNGRKRAANYLTQTEFDLKTFGADWLAELELEPTTQTNEKDRGRIQECGARDMVPDLELRALGAAISQGTIAAAKIYQSVLLFVIRRGKLKADRARCLRRARDGRLAGYQQLAWLAMAIAAAPDDANGWAHRARWLSRHQLASHARGDWTRAIALAPKRAALYEGRALGCFHRDFWSAAHTRPSAVEDLMEAYRLRIAAGKISGAPRRLQRRADALIEGLDVAVNVNIAHRLARAYALYSLALQREPNAPALWQGRAHLMGGEWQTRWARARAHRAVAAEDYARALALDGALEDARTGLVRNLSATTQRETAHAQIEALLVARQALLDAGIDARLARAILGEVESALGL